MEKFLVCIESFIDHSLDSLYQLLDDRDNAASRVGMLSYAAEIQCNSRNDAEEILRSSEQDLCMMYRDIYEGRPWFAPLVPFEMEEVHDGYFECAGHRASVFWIESVSKIWTVSDVSRARLEYNRWLHSDDELKDVPDNRPCVLLRFCEEHAKVRQVVSASIHHESENTLSTESAKKNEQPPSASNETEDEWLRASEAIKLFSKSKSTFYNRVNAGLIEKQETETGPLYSKSSVLECKRKNP